MHFLTGIQINELAAIWPTIYGLVSDACEYNNGRYIAEDYYYDLAQGQKQLWLINNESSLKAIVITEIAIFPQMKCCVIDICTGDTLAEWIGLLSIIEDWAKTQDCKQMFFHARPGFERKLNNYKKTHVILEKNLA